jgi:hypothetical protein
VSVADPTPAAAAHGEHDDHDNRGDGRKSDPEDRGTKNTLHDRHPSPWAACPIEAGSTFTSVLPPLDSDEISSTSVTAAPVAAQRPRMDNLRGRERHIGIPEEVGPCQGPVRVGLVVCGGWGRGPGFGTRRGRSRGEGWPWSRRNAAARRSERFMEGPGGRLPPEGPASPRVERERPPSMVE